MSEKGLLSKQGGTAELPSLTITSQGLLIFIGKHIDMIYLYLHDLIVLINKKEL